VRVVEEVADQWQCMLTSEAPLNPRRGDLWIGRISGVVVFTVYEQCFSNLRQSRTTSQAFGAHEDHPSLVKFTTS
jgi:hypothetical protein